MDELLKERDELREACKAALRFAEFVAEKNGTRNQARDINAHEELWGTAAQLRAALNRSAAPSKVAPGEPDPRD